MRCIRAGRGMEMVDLENVIRGLECCRRGFCFSCPYNDGIDENVECKQKWADDALSLLKAQEPVKPYIDYDGQDVWRCGSCGATLFHLSHTQADENEQNCVKFCRYCGKAVKWDG